MEEDSDRTVTENSEQMSEGEIKKSRRKKHFKEDRMNAIYSTRQDQDESYASNYEGDEFEEEDPDDDFNLPWDHDQNTEGYKMKPHFLSTGSQATAPLKRKVPREETKVPEVVPKEVQKENQIRDSLRGFVSKLQEAGHKAKQGGNGDGGELNNCYLFIRQISTYIGLQDVRKLDESGRRSASSGSLVETAR